MNIAQIEENLSNLIRNFSKENFIYELLLAYGLPKTTITLLKKGKHNLAKKAGQIILKKKLFFQECEDQDLHVLIDSIKNDEATNRHNPRFIIVTDFKIILAIDTKTKDTLDEKIINLNKRFDFFLPWAGMEKASHKNENPADVKAAEKMAKIYDEIQKDNQFKNEEDLKNLNIFLSRLLFCFFAEDTGIFKLSSFIDTLDSNTQIDGSDLDQYFEKFFEVLNSKDRTNFPHFLQQFPYVNGGLFSQKINIPKFFAKSRRLIIECGELDWQDINPDIFGSMMQAVVNNEQRSVMGMHYTSVPNIMKVIEPLFLQELKNEFDKNFDDYKKLNQLLLRLENIRIFDPACGSGNFLIIAFKELKKLEIEILNRIRQITPAFAFPFSRIRLSQFYGIEIDDFACQIAKLSLWLAEHQMNVKFKEVFGACNPTLPLKEGGRIVCGNATRLNWEEVCPKDEGREVYILGNPPYLGYSLQDENQKSDMLNTFRGFGSYKELDYIACWFFLGSQYIRNFNAKIAFVSTNSISQGEQVSMLWPNIFLMGLEIFFAYPSFKWSNNAKRNAGVTCVIIGLSNKIGKKKILFSKQNKEFVDNINAYLIKGSDTIIHRRSKPISDLPQAILGNMAKDEGHLYLDKSSYSELVETFPTSKKFIKKALGSAEFIKGLESWCLWIGDNDLNEAMSIDPIARRLNLVSEFRKKSKAASTSEYAKYPNRFMQRTHKSGNSIIVPRVASERRPYIIAGFLNEEVIVKDSAYAIYNAEPYIFGLISSRLHMVWTRIVSGQLETRIRYSTIICYNNFPVPELSDKGKQNITSHVYNILEEREKHPEKTMAELYDPNKMPAGLKKAHQDLDVAIELCYRSKPFSSDEERLEHLFKLYEEMVNE